MYFSFFNIDIRIKPKEVYMARPKTDPNVIKKNLETLASWRNKKNILSELDLSIRSDILYLTIKKLVQVEKAPTHQLAQLMDKHGFVSANTPYRFELYIAKINERYDLPIAIRQNWIYLDPAYKVSKITIAPKKRARLTRNAGE